MADNDVTRSADSARLPVSPRVTSGRHGAVSPAPRDQSARREGSGAATPEMHITPNVVSVSGGSPRLRGAQKGERTSTRSLRRFPA